MTSLWIDTPCNFPTSKRNVSKGICDAFLFVDVVSCFLLALDSVVVV